MMDTLCEMRRNVGGTPLRQGGPARGLLVEETEEDCCAIHGGWVAPPACAVSTAGQATLLDRLAIAEAWIGISYAVKNRASSSKLACSTMCWATTGAALKENMDGEFNAR